MAMGNTTSLLSDFVGPSLVMVSHFLDFFVAGNTLTSRGDYLTGGIADVIQAVAEFMAMMSTLLF